MKTTEKPHYNNCIHQLAKLLAHLKLAKEHLYRVEPIRIGSIANILLGKRLEIVC